MLDTNDQPVDTVSSIYQKSQLSERVKKIKIKIGDNLKNQGGLKNIKSASEILSNY